MDKSAANQMNISQVNINAQLEMILKRLRPIAKKGNGGVDSGEHAGSDGRCG